MYPACILHVLQKHRHAKRQGPNFPMHALTKQRLVHNPWPCYTHRRTEAPGPSHSPSPTACKPTC